MTPDTPRRRRRIGPEVRAVLNDARACYIGFAGFCLHRAFAYSPLLASEVQEPPPEAIQLLIGTVSVGGWAITVPLLVWSAAWFIAGIVAVLGAVRPRTVCLIPMLVMIVLWSAAYIVSWAVGESRNGWLTAGLFWPLLFVLFGGTRMAARALTDARTADRMAGR